MVVMVYHCSRCSIAYRATRDKAPRVARSLVSWVGLGFYRVGFLSCVGFWFDNIVYSVGSVGIVFICLY